MDQTRFKKVTNVDYTERNFKNSGLRESGLWQAIKEVCLAFEKLFTNFFSKANECFWFVNFNKLNENIFFNSPYNRQSYE